MKKFIFIFILMVPFLHAQNYFWNDVDLPLQQLFTKMGTPDGVEYQKKSNIYWMAYDFGDVAVMYVIDKGFVRSVLYMKSTKDFDSVYKPFIELQEKSLEDGFIIKKTKDIIGHYIQVKNDIQIVGDISQIKDEFILTILISRMKK